MKPIHYLMDVKFCYLLNEIWINEIKTPTNVYVVLQIPNMCYICLWSEHKMVSFDIVYRHLNEIHFLFNLKSTYLGRNQ